MGVWCTRRTWLYCFVVLFSLRCSLDPNKSNHSFLFWRIYFRLIIHRCWERKRRYWKLQVCGYYVGIRSITWRRRMMTPTGTPGPPWAHPVNLFRMKTRPLWPHFGPPKTKLMESQSKIPKYSSKQTKPNLRTTFRYDGSPCYWIGTEISIVRNRKRNIRIFNQSNFSYRQFYWIICVDIWLNRPIILCGCMVLRHES